MECITCAFFEELNGVKTTFGFDVYWTLMPWTMLLTVSGFTLYMTISLLRNYLAGEGLTKVLQKSAIGLCGLVLMTVFATWRDDTNVPLVYQWVLDPIEGLALFMGSAIISSGLGEAGMGSTYGGLAGVVENQVFFILSVIGKSIANKATFSNAMTGALFESLIGGILILLPFLFVWGVFAAFLVEAMFKFVAAGITAPILLPMAVMPFTRSFPISMLRIVFGGALTIVFASGAMGFTMAVIEKTSTPIVVEIAAQEAVTLARKIRNQQCSDYFTSTRGRLGGITSDASPECKKAESTYAARVTAASNAQSFGLWSQDFFMMFVIGFVSILLHLQAKSLASNISGANDGAGPAAATVAAGKMALGAGFMATNTGLFGAGGATTSITAAMGQTRPGAALAQHGLVGGGPAAIRNYMFPNSGGGGGAGGGNPFGDTMRGGSMSSGSDPRLAQTLDRIADILDNRR